MSDEDNAGLGNEPADVTLDSIIDKAIADVEARDGAAQTAEPDGETNQSTTERTRDDKGRFVAKDTAADASKESADAASLPADQQAKPEPALQPIEAPARWTGEQKAAFAKWPRDVQESVVERYKAIEADYTRKTQEAAEIRRTAEPWLNAVKPFEQYLQQIAPQVGQTPDQLVRSLLATEYQLRTGSLEQRLVALQQIAGSYGVDLGALARGEVPQPDPVSNNNLRQHISALEQRLAQFEQQTQAEQQRQLSSHIEQFAQAKDETGRPRYPHFERVRGVMGQLMAQGQAASLEDAYQKAVAPLQEAIAEELRKRQEEVEKQNAEALAKAKKVQPVKSTGSQPNGAAKAKGLDAILDQALSSAGIV